MRQVAHFSIRICAEASQIPRIQIPLRDLYSCADAELEVRRACLSEKRFGMEVKMDEHDMIVNLKNIEYREPEDGNLRIKRAFAGDKETILRFVRENFSESWTAEAECAILQMPSQCFIATEQGRVLGFACYDVSAKGFFGPIGVLESERGRQIGKYLLLKTLDAMRSVGYGYAIIGWVSEAEGFYRRTVHAEAIPDSAPKDSVYSNLVRMP